MPSFVDDLLEKYTTLWTRIGPGHSEHDERVAWANVLLEKALGYQHSLGDYQIEQLATRRDILVYNADRDPVIVVETKRAEVGIQPADEAQLFGYVVPTTRFAILTDGNHIRLFRNDEHHTVLANLDMTSLTARPIEADTYAISPDERAALEHFLYLTKEELWQPQYDDFTLPFEQRRSIRDDAAFDAMIKDLEKCVTYVRDYALRAFDYFESQVTSFQAEEQRLLADIETLRAAGNEVDATRLWLELRQKRTDAQRFSNFGEDYRRWLQLSNRRTGTAPQRQKNKEVFCTESVYVLLNKLLFIRICEDKNLLTRKVSNGGITIWRDFTTYLKDSYKDLLTFAFNDATKLYRHLFAEGVFDWYLTSDEDLNLTLQRVLWRLNLYDFSGVDRDILGKLYEKYFPRDVRKALGEFYTRETVVDFILDAVGYTPDRDLRGLLLLDPACGSGTFPVRALGRLLGSLNRLGLPHSARLQQATTNVNAFDINPFACAIAEMNLVFQLIDDYVNSGQQAGDLPRVAVYQTDSLAPSGLLGASSDAPLQLTLGAMLSPGSSMLLDDRNAVDNLKTKKYDLIVGNPPYVRSSDAALRRRYAAILSGGADTYRYFLTEYLGHLKSDGQLGFIVPNTWLADQNSRTFRSWLLERYRLLLAVYLPYYVKAFYDVDQATTILVLRPKSDHDDDVYPVTVGEARSLEELANNTFARITQPLNVIVTHDERYALHHTIAIQTVAGAYGLLQRIRDASFPTLVPHLVRMVHNGELQSAARQRISETYAPGRAPCIIGLNITNYYVDMKPTRRKAKWYASNVTVSRDGHATQPRLMEMSTARLTQRKRIKVGYVDPSRVAGKKVYTDSRYANYILASDCLVDDAYVEGILNSAPLNFYFKAYSSNNHVNSTDLERLPVPLPDEGNKPLADRMIAAVGKMRKLHTDRDDATQRISAPLHDANNLVALFDSKLLVGFPGGIAIGDAVTVEGSSVRLDGGILTCRNDAVARLLAITLRSLGPQTLLSAVEFPDDEETATALLAAYDEAVQAQTAFHETYASLDQEIDSLAYELYGILDGKAIVERSLRTANPAGSVQYEDDEVSDDESTDEVQEDMDSEADASDAGVTPV